MDQCEQHNYNINVQTVVTDFEDGVLCAFLAIFGRDIQNKGCFYHLIQATWCKIQELILVPAYNGNENFHLSCAMIDRLAFLPVDQVGDGMEYLKSIIPGDVEQAEDLLMYFK